MKSKIKELIDKEIEAIQNIPIDGIIEPVIDIIHNRVHKKGGKLIISGMGKAGQIGMNIATTLSSTGTPSVFIHPSEAQHGDLGVVQKNVVSLTFHPELNNDEYYLNWLNDFIREGKNVRSF